MSTATDDTRTAPGGPVAAPEAIAVTEAVFVYAARPAEPWEPFRAAAAALADNGLAAEYGVVTGIVTIGRVVIARQDGGPLPAPGAPRWRKLSRLVREAIGPSDTGG